MASWDPTRARGQLRLAAQRLAQMRDRIDAQGNILSRDIATLLGQRSTMLARAKAQRLIHDEITGDMLEHLEMHLGILSERIAELDSRTPSPPVVEASATTIYAAQYVNQKDLDVVRDMLGVCLGSEFLQAAVTNRDQLASSKVIRALSAPPPSAAELDAYLLEIAKTYKVDWEPELRTDDVLRVLSEILDKTNAAPTVDMPRLRRICVHGIPSAPPFLRPRTYKLLLGTLPNLKSGWDKEAMKSRANYYELVRRLLAPFADLPLTGDPLDPLDAALVAGTKDLFRVPYSLFAGLEDAPDAFPDCPLDAVAPVELRIPFAGILSERLDAIHAQRDVPSTSASANGAPSISLTTPDGALPEEEPTTANSARAFSTGGAHPSHGAALVRLLYIHSQLNPAHRAPHLASLLIPLYSVLLQEVEPTDLAHVEADAFWLFEALVGEFAELEDEEGAGKWMEKFGERVKWADADLAADLQTKGLSPNLPHYSYRWLAPLLTHTLPLSSTLTVWDALFSRETTTREASPKVDYLLDVCTAMLLRARGPISRLGKPGRRSPGLWGEEDGYREPPSPVRAWELNDAFIEGMALLQLYPLEAAGGVESVLQTAADLASRRKDEAQRAQKAAAASSSTLGARLRDTVWRGFTNQIGETPESPETSDEEEEEEESESSGKEEEDEGDETERLSGRPATGLAATLTNTRLWKGLSNQAALEVSPSPPAAPSQPSTLHSPSSSISSQNAGSTSSAGTSLWSYAEKLRDSDAAAALAKASTNWRVKAMQAWTTRGEPVPASTKARSGSVSAPSSTKHAVDDPRRGSLPPRDPREVYSPPVRPIHSPPAPYSPPARPAFFRPPRDSWMPQPRRSPLSSPSTPDTLPEEEAPQRGRVDALRESLVSLTAFAATPKPSPIPPPEKRAAPRPLLLSSSNLMTLPSPGHSRTPSRPPSRAPSRSPRPSHDRFDMHTRQDSMQSVSSISDMLGQPSRGSDAESDGTESRFVRLNRTSISPMALAARHARMASISSETSASAVPPVPPLPTPPFRSSTRGWAQADLPDSPSTLPSSPPPHTPPTSALKNVITVADMDTTPVRVLQPPAQRKLVRKKTPPPPEDTSDSLDESARPRLRAKRLTQLHISRDSVFQPSPIAKSPSIMSPASSYATSISPGGATLAPPQWEEYEAVPTPRAASFPSNQQDLESERSTTPVSPRPRTRKVSGEGARIRKLSSTRGRKVSDARPASVARESGAEEGDDEGYDELLSAYESEDSASRH